MELLHSGFSIYRNVRGWYDLTARVCFARTQLGVRRNNLVVDGVVFLFWTIQYNCVQLVNRNASPRDL